MNFSPAKFDFGDLVTLKTGYKGVIWKVRSRWREHPKASWEYRIEAQEPYDINFMLGPFIDVEESEMNAIPGGGNCWTGPSGSVYNTDMTQLDISKLTDQELVDLKKRMESAGERLTAVRQNLDAAIVSVEAAVDRTETAAKWLPLNREGTNEAWVVAGQLNELRGTLRVLRHAS